MKVSDVKRHVFTGVSYMIPIVVIGGLSMAVAKVLGGYSGGEEGSVAYMINQIGKIAMQFAVPVLSAGIAYSIAEKPGVAPGIVIGWLSNDIKAGFIGGMIGGFLVGYMVLFLIKYLKLPKAIEGIKPVILIPLLSAILSSLVLMLFIGKPISAFQTMMFNVLTSMQGSSKFLLGAIIGGSMGIDMGGPINKTVCLFSNGLFADGIYTTTAAKIIGGMTPPLGVGIAVLLLKKKYSKAEQETAKAAIPLGLCYITEGVLPFAASDPLRVIPACMIGSAVAGGLVTSWNVISKVTHGGIFIIPLLDNNPWGFVFALIIGSATTAGILVTLKLMQKSNDNELENIEEEDEEELSFEIKNI